MNLTTYLVHDGVKYEMAGNPEVWQFTNMLDEEGNSNKDIRIYFTFEDGTKTSFQLRKLTDATPSTIDCDLSLDFAIEHAREAGERLSATCDTLQCGLEHLQLSQWLTELKALRQAIQPIVDCRLNYTEDDGQRAVDAVLESVRTYNSCFDKKPSR